jgi:hypothetical protein
MMILTGDQMREGLRAMGLLDHFVIEDIVRVEITPEQVDVTRRFPIAWAPQEPAGTDSPARGEGIPDRWPL